MSVRPVLATLSALLAGASAAAGQSLFVYAFNQQGNVSANAYPLDSLPHGSASDEEIWFDLFVKGPDRWLIRGDGKISKNGENFFTLSDDQKWRGLVVDGVDDFFALSRGGRVSDSGGIVVDYSAGEFEFKDIVTDGTNVYVLKSNGAVFHVPDPDGNPIIKFDGPPGKISGAEADGEALDTIWVRLHINPATGEMWALRQDGRIRSAPIPPTPPVTPSEGDVVSNLPYEVDDNEIDQDKLYYDFTFDVDGAWYALRADGRLFSEAAQGPPLVDYPGEPSDNANQTYKSVAALDGQTLALRADGKVFRDLDTTAIIDLKNAGYVRLVLGVVLPNLTNTKNQPPVGSKMTVVAPEGADVAVPVIATDRDLPSEDLVLDVVPETLPAGATWDGPSRTILWPAAGPKGTYKVQVTISDGIANPVKAVQTITVKPPDTNPDKNKKPNIAKLAKAIALVGLPFAMQVEAFDLDGDPVVLSLDVSKPPPLGAAFDDVTDVLTWDAPTLTDKGSNPFKFFGDDGTAQAKRTIKVKVETSLLAF